MIKTSCIPGAGGAHGPARRRHPMAAVRLFQEPLVLTHQHLGLQSLDRLQRHAHHDDDGGAADGHGVVSDDSASLVWFKASDFCYTIPAGSSQGFL